MLDADKEWLYEVCHRSLLAHKLKVAGYFTEEERRRWERLYERFPEEYMQVLNEVNPHNIVRRNDYAP